MGGFFFGLVFGLFLIYSEEDTYLVNDKWMSVIQIVPTQISRTTWKQTVIRLKDLISNQIDRSECNPPKRGRWVGSDDLEAQRQIVGTCSSVTVPAPMADTVNQSLHTFNDEF